MEEIKNQKRGIRLTKLKTIKRKVSKFSFFTDYEKVFGKKAYKRRVGIHSHSRAICSCPMCGNPRKFYGNGDAGKTLQELRLNQRDHY